jgi:serine protease Do
VAVLKIEASGLPAVRLGDPGRLSVGEWVLAIGSPFGFENSVTAGIVSAKARALPDQDYVPFIQTDAAVNPGNSGGPLFNLRGEVVGINSQIYSRSGGYQGLSFAIPIDIAMKVQKQLLDHGKVVRGRIGASIQDMDQDLAESFGLKSADGALVAAVERDSPAERAGLQPGDVVLSVDGQRVAASKDLPPLIAALKPGTEATLDIWRNRAGRQIQVKVGKLTETTPVADAQDADTGRLGLALRELSPDDRRHLNAELGLLVIEATGPAARAGVRPGDVILSANGAPLHTVEELRLMARKGPHHIALLIQRNDMRIFIPVGVG